MNQAIITTKNRNDLIKLISFVKDLKYVTAVEPFADNLSRTKGREKIKPLSDEDWIRPGRPATDEEIEQLCIEMEHDEGGDAISTAYERQSKGQQK